jgi:hypothetical protein
VKPPTSDALRYAATVLGRECTALERLLDAAGSPTGAAREQLSQLLAHVRSVRTWILGVEMPRAERRAPLSERIDARKRVLARARKAATSPLGVVSAIAHKLEVCKCGHTTIDHRDNDHSSCQVNGCDCAGFTYPLKTCADCGRTLSACELLAYDRAVCFYCHTGTSPTECEECGSTLVHVAGPNVKGTVCPECDRDSALLEDEDDTHEPDCRCSECADHPLTATAGEALDRAIGKLVASNQRMALSALESPIKALMGAMIDPGELGPVACSHANAHPSKLVPAFTCPDCGALFQRGAR